MMITDRMGLIIAIGLMFVFSGAAKAQLIYDCSGGSARNGNDYAVSVVSHTGSTYRWTSSSDRLGADFGVVAVGG
jgi:hypothetical protein